MLRNTFVYVSEAASTMSPRAHATSSLCLSPFLGGFRRRELERERQTLASQRVALDKEAKALQYQVSALLEQR